MNLDIFSSHQLLFEHCLEMFFFEPRMRMRSVPDESLMTVYPYSSNENSPPLVTKCNQANPKCGKYAIYIPASTCPITTMLMSCLLSDRSLSYSALASRVLTKVGAGQRTRQTKVG